MILEEFPKEALVGEVQFFSNFLNVLDGILKLYPQFQDDIVVDPFVGCAVTDRAHGLGKILRGDAEFLGIPTYATFVSEVHLYFLDELCEDNLLT